MLLLLLFFRGSIAAVGAGQQEVVEIISQNEGMRSALKRLCDVLTPFLNEENTDVSTLSGVISRTKLFDACC
jgi:hypothetical protein